MNKQVKSQKRKKINLTKKTSWVVFLDTTFFYIKKTIGRIKKYYHLPKMYFWGKTKVISVFLLFWLFLLLVGIFKISNKTERSFRYRLSYPYLAITHLNLAVNYYNSGYLLEAQNTMAGLEQKPFLRWQIKIIPVWSKKYDQAHSLISNRQNIKKEIEKWEKWIKDNPPSRDIYLQLAQFYWQVKDDTMAQKYASKAAYLDPADNNVLQLQKEIFNPKLNK